LHEEEDEDPDVLGTDGTAGGLDAEER
jgi:hypothetical protein